MGVGGADNFKWMKVLEWGEASAFADWFDIDWEPDRAFLRGKVLIPLLGDQYGAVLESGALRLAFETDGSFAVWAYGTHKLPISPLHYDVVLGGGHSLLAPLGKAFAELPAHRDESDQRAETLKSQLSQLAETNSEVRRAIDGAVAEFNGAPGNLASWERLDSLIRKQFWRPAYFRVAADDINYRRFFNINELAGIRVESPAVFDEIHRHVFQWIADGVLDGLRLDHIDGLFDPKAYCVELRERAPRTIHLFVEKILAPHESLREDWNTDGTTGYEFANLMTGLLVDASGEKVLTSVYADFSGETRSSGEIVRICKLRIMESEMASELNVLAREAGRLARSNPRTQDFTNNVLHRALKEIIACFPVYRTYVDATQTTDADRRDLDWAVAQARRREPAIDESVFDFLHAALSCELALDGGFDRNAVVTFAMRAQQYSGPVMAKGLEDTAFYRYNRFLALNEVGGSPERFGVSIAAFHAANQQRLKKTPHALLATSTHDTKRGEDARARLAVLSEMPEAWAARVSAWSRILRAPEAGSEERAPPSPNDEYAFYQILLGAWPAELLDRLDEPLLESFRLRIEGAVLKSLREAKVYSTWVKPNEAYEKAVLDFVRRALDGSRSNPFLGNFVEFARKVAVLGTSNSLVQTAFKLTVPGVPDIYQGAELWNFSLVDPDNRNATDYSTRATSLQQADCHPIRTLLERWPDGRIKQRLVRDLLRVRSRHPRLFSEGSYEPVEVSGPRSDHVCAFTRSKDDVTLLVVGALHPYLAEKESWRGTRISFSVAKKWRKLFGESELPVQSKAFDAASLFRPLPIAVLLSTGER
jgi:(1->4)-alpha-D-glucan 1-alpha-D-glucosylmutase